MSYAKLHSADHPVFKGQIGHNTLAAYEDLSRRANTSDRSNPARPLGHVVVSRAKLAEHLDCNESTARTYVNRLKAAKLLVVWREAVRGPVMPPGPDGHWRGLAEECLVVALATEAGLADAQARAAERQAAADARAAAAAQPRRQAVHGPNGQFAKPAGHTGRLPGAAPRLPSVVHTTAVFNPGSPDPGSPDPGKAAPLDSGARAQHSKSRPWWDNGAAREAVDHGIHSGRLPCFNRPARTGLADNLSQAAAEGYDLQLLVNELTKAWEVEGRNPSITPAVLWDTATLGGPMEFWEITKGWATGRRNARAEVAAKVALNRAMSAHRSNPSTATEAAYMKAWEYHRALTGADPEGDVPF